MAGLLAKTTGLRSWWGEGAVIAAYMRASCPAAKQAGTASTAGATQQPAQGGRRTGGAFHASYLAEKRRFRPSEAVRQLFLVGRRACGKILVGGLARRSRWNSVETRRAKAIQKLLRRRLGLPLQFTTQITFDSISLTHTKSLTCEHLCDFPSTTLIPHYTFAYLHHGTRDRNRSWNHILMCRHLPR